MTLPTFLGIGVQRAGTTWLHTMLAGHASVYMPTQRKEIRYFDRHHAKGLEWYARFFPPPEQARSFAAIGEISPQYLYCEACADRIGEATPDARLLAMLRHPVDRAFSNYGFVVQRRNFPGSFEEFIAQRPDMLEKGFYSRYLQRYRDRFGMDRLLLIVFEDAMRDGRSARERVGTFLGVDPEGFPRSVGKVNATVLPRYPTLSSAAVRVGRRLRQRGFDRVVDAAARAGARRTYGSGRPLPTLDPRLHESLSQRFEGEFDTLERTFGLDITSWRSTRTAVGGTA